MKEKRITPQPTEQELYKTNIKKSLEKERRKDNLELLLEVQQQKRVWKITFTFCLLLNLLLLTMGIIGTYFNG